MNALETHEEAEANDLYQWHLDQFRALGFKRHQAEILELAHVDWREAKDLRDLGCPPELAVHILT